MPISSDAKVANGPETGNHHGDVGYKDFVHTGPGTLAGRYLRMFWQPVFHSKDLAPGTAAPFRIMSEGFTLYRGESGTAHVMAFQCAHRGTQLSTGWIEGDCIRCFYHGWKYDGAGQCIVQPAEPAPFASKVRIRSYPAREYLGLIFAYLGEGEPPSFPRYTDFEDFEGLLEWDSYVRNCNYFNNLENSLDPGHVGFVHRAVAGSFDGLTNSPKSYAAKESDWGITFTAVQRSGGKRVSQFGMPNMFHLKGLPNDPEIAGHREFLAWWVPIDDERHIQFGVYALRVQADKVPGYVERRDARLATRDHDHNQVAEAILSGALRLRDVDAERTDVVRLQDDIAQTGQGRVADREHERLGRSDAGVLAIRKLWIRELKALAEGRRLKPWTYDAQRLAVVRDFL